MHSSETGTGSATAPGTVEILAQGTVDNDRMALGLCDGDAVIANEKPALHAASEIGLEPRLGQRFLESRQVQFTFREPERCLLPAHTGIVVGAESIGLGGLRLAKHGTARGRVRSIDQATHTRHFVAFANTFEVEPSEEGVIKPDVEHARIESDALALAQVGRKARVGADMLAKLLDRARARREHDDSSRREVRQDASQRARIRPALNINVHNFAHHLQLNGGAHNLGRNHALSLARPASVVVVVGVMPSCQLVDQVAVGQARAAGVAAIVEIGVRAESAGAEEGQRVALAVIARSFARMRLMSSSGMGMP